MPLERIGWLVASQSPSFGSPVKPAMLIEENSACAGSRSRSLSCARRIDRHDTRTSARKNCSDWCPWSRERSCQAHPRRQGPNYFVLCRSRIRACDRCFSCVQAIEERSARTSARKNRADSCPSSRERSRQVSFLPGTRVAARDPNVARNLLSDAF